MPLPDPLRGYYEGSTAAMLARMVATGVLTETVAIGDPRNYFSGPDDVAGSDLNVTERAWLRALYWNMRHGAAEGYSARVTWGGWVQTRLRSVLFTARTATVELVPRTFPPDAEAYTLQPGLQSQYRKI